MNKYYKTSSFGKIFLTSKIINKNFRIKVNGVFNGKKINKLVGISGLLEILGSWDKLVKFVLRAFNSDDRCICKVYGQPMVVTFYWK